MSVWDIVVLVTAFAIGYVYIKSGSKHYLVGTIWSPQEVNRSLDNKKFFIFKIKYEDKETKESREMWMAIPLGWPVFSPKVENFRPGEEISVKLSRKPETITLLIEDGETRGVVCQKTTRIHKPSEVVC